MRFGETLRYNANTEWWEQYLRYNYLKKRIKFLRALRRKSIVRITDEPPTSVAAIPQGDSSDEEGGPPAAPPPVHRSASHAVLAGLNRLAGAEAVADSQGPLNRLAGAESAPDSTGPLNRLSATEELAYSPGASFTTNAVRVLLPTLTVGDADSDGEVRDTPETMSDSALMEEFQAKDAEFMKEIEDDVRKIERFYAEMLLMLPQVTDQIDREVAELRASARAHGFSTGDDDESTPLLASSTGNPISDIAFDKRASTLQNTIGMQFRDIKDLISFSELNARGLGKILKKHDKNCGTQTRMQKLEKFRRENKFFWPEQLKVMLQRTVETYADVYARGDIPLAKTQLAQWDKRLVTFDKDTLWKDLLRNERKVSSLAYKGQGAPGSADPLVGRSPKMFFLGLGLLFFTIAMLYPQFIRVLPPPTTSSHKYSVATLDTASRCAGLLLFAIIVWASEALPLYVTSLIVIPAASILRLYPGTDGNPLPASEAAKTVFAHMASSTILLVICVYALGAALSKFGIDKTVATMALSQINKAESLVLGVLVLSVVLSVFVSNVAAPVLLISVLLPVLQDMPAHARPCVQCLLFAVMIGR